MTEYIIRAEEYTIPMLNRLLIQAQEGDIFKLIGCFEYEPELFDSFVLGKVFCDGILNVTKAGVTIDGSAAQLIFSLKQKPHHDIKLIEIDKNAVGARITGLQVTATYQGEPTVCRLTAVSNEALGVSIRDCRFTLRANSQINMTGLNNDGHLCTTLATPADQLVLSGCEINLYNTAQEWPLDNTCLGVINHLANAICVNDCNIFVQNVGNSEAQKAIGLYNNGRYCRFANNNIKANGSHNLGARLDQASTCGAVDDGAYSLWNNNNLVGEWGGTCTGLLLRGDHCKADGNKILATHTIKGRSAKIQGFRNLVCGNMITSTSRNFRLIEVMGNHCLISGNLLDAAIGTAENYITAVGIYLKNAYACLVGLNHINNIKDCGIYMEGCIAMLKDNYIEQVASVPHFKSISSNEDETLFAILDETKIVSME